MTQPPGARAWACWLTPEGRGAVAVLGVTGPDAVQVASAAFRPNREPALDQTPPGRLRVGRVGAGPGDEVVAVIVPGCPPAVEFQTHGGPAARGIVQQALAAAGASIVGPAEWTALRGASRLSAQAALALAQAPTARAAEHLLAQREGALEGALRAIQRTLESDPAGAVRALESLLLHAPFGLRLVSGWRVVLAGRPNVGKSRMLNALAGFERAIVAPTPGTTRDVVTLRTAIDGLPVEIADTAGLRPAGDAIEAHGVARARQHQAGADLVLLVLDRSEPLTPDDTGLLAAYPDALRVANKADLPAAWNPLAESWVIVSAESGQGLDCLIAAIAMRLVPSAPDVAAPLPFLPLHQRWLERARGWLVSGRPDAAGRVLSRLLESGARRRHARP